MEDKYTIQGLDEYIRQSEPLQQERGEAWQVAIGLQQVDGLTPSSFLLDTARKHIAGDISITEAKHLIDSYYESAKGRSEIETERTEEADKVSARITNLSSQKEIKEIQSANPALNPVSKCKNCTLEELALLRMVKEQPSITQKEMAEKIGKSERTLKSLTIALQEKGLLRRVGGKRDGRWEVVNQNETKSI